MKLFNKEETLKEKLEILYHETSEPRTRMLYFLKNFKLLSFIKLTTMFTLGLIAGFFIKVNLDIDKN